MSFGDQGTNFELCAARAAADWLQELSLLHPHYMMDVLGRYIISAAAAQFACDSLSVNLFHPKGLQSALLSLAEEFRKQIQCCAIAFHNAREHAHIASPRPGRAALRANLHITIAYCM